MGARDLLADLAGAGLRITADGDRLVIRPASKLTDAMRAALRAQKPEVLALLAATQPHGARAHLVDMAASAWADGDIARFTTRRARLLRWGWPEPEAEALAERLVKRDRAADDDRVSCAECHHHRPGRCGNHRAAGLHTPDMGRDLAGLLQRCPGHQPMRG
jgi:cytochrome c peroxidase